MTEKIVEPFVSVLVTTYNHEKYITQAIDIESILAQKCNFDFEIVIGEDFSKDDTRKICLELQRKYPQNIKLILNSENKGLLRNFCDTMLQCNGKYIAECSGDDFWNDANKLQKQIDILEANPDVVLVHTGWNELHIVENPLSYKTIEQKPNARPGKTGKESTKQLMNQTNQTCVYTCSACYRKDAVDKIFKQYPQFFFESKYLCEDYQLVFFLLQAGNFYYMEDKTITYRILPESASHSADIEKSFHFKFNVLLLRLAIFNELRLNVSDAEKYLKFASHSLLKLAFRAKQKDLANMAYNLFHEIKFNISCRDKILFFIIQKRILFCLFYQLYLTKSKLRLS